MNSRVIPELVRAPSQKTSQMCAVSIRRFPRVQTMIPGETVDYDFFHNGYEDTVQKDISNVVKVPYGSKSRSKLAI